MACLVGILWQLIGWRQLQVMVGLRAQLRGGGLECLRDVQSRGRWGIVGPVVRVRSRGRCLGELRRLTRSMVEGDGRRSCRREVPLLLFIPLAFLTVCIPGASSQGSWRCNVWTANDGRHGPVWGSCARSVAPRIEFCGVWVRKDVVFAFPVWPVVWIREGGVGPRRRGECVMVTDAFVGELCADGSRSGVRLGLANGYRALTLGVGRVGRGGRRVVWIGPCHFCMVSGPSWSAASAMCGFEKAVSRDESRCCVRLRG